MVLEQHVIFVELTGRNHEIKTKFGNYFFNKLQLQCILKFPFFVAHSIKGMIATRNSFPRFVSEYSTLGGISLNACLDRMSSFCNSFSMDAKVEGPIPFSSSNKSLYLREPWLPISFTSSRLHFLPIVSIISSNGHKQTAFWKRNEYEMII